jgi:exodeoxyribonuclease VII large subunit
MESISLLELNTHIQRVVKQNFVSALWVRAEISELKERSGHCYLELVEKDSSSDNIIAKSKASIWAGVYRMIKPYFESETGESFRAGLKILIAVTVEFHEIYGLSLIVKDIEPTFTVGELAARRTKIIRRLKEEGIAEMNKEVPFPMLPRRIALISSPVAAGYGDFLHQIKNNSAGFAFYTKLFPAVMQGEQAEVSIISALEKIFRHIDLFDVVLITRGGGATADLACFDSYNIALNCTQFPLPIISAIGHQKDVSILDMVAHTSVKTPTAAAEFLLSVMKNAENAMQSMAFEISSCVKNTLDEQNSVLTDKKWKIRQTLKNKITGKIIHLEKKINRLRSALKIRMLNEKTKIDALARKIESHSPSFLLKYGYTITAVNGERLQSIKKIKKGDTIRTFVSDGEITSTVSNISES